MKKYTNLGELLLDYRLSHYWDKEKHYIRLKTRPHDESLTQEDLASFLSNNLKPNENVAVRTINRWESNQGISDTNLSQLTKVLGIPYEVLFRVRYKYSTFYSMINNRYATCPFNMEYINKKILQEKLFSDERTTGDGNIEPLKISTRGNIQKTIKFNLLNYPYNIELSNSVFLKAFDFLGELNLLINDPFNFYSGHLICLPLKISSYELMKNGNNKKEFEIEINDLEKPDLSKPIVLYIFSLFSTNSTYVYYLMKRFINFLIINYNRRIHEQSIIARYAVTKDGLEFSRKMGLKKVYDGYEDGKLFGTEVTPRMYESKIYSLKWIMNYLTS